MSEPQTVETISEKIIVSSLNVLSLWQYCYAIDSYTKTIVSEKQWLIPRQALAGCS